MQPDAQHDPEITEQHMPDNWHALLIALALDGHDLRELDIDIGGGNDPTTGTLALEGQTLGVLRYFWAYAWVHSDGWTRRDLSELLAYCESRTARGHQVYQYHYRYPPSEIVLESGGGHPRRFSLILPVLFVLVLITIIVMAMMWLR